MGARCLQCVCFAAQKEEEQKIKDYRRSNLTRRLSQFNFNDEEGMAAAAMFVRSGAKLKFQNEFKEGFASNVLENGDLTTRNDDPCQRRPSHRSHQYLWHVAHPASEEHPCEQEDAETGADDNVSPFARQRIERRWPLHRDRRKRLTPRNTFRLAVCCSQNRAWRCSKAKRCWKGVFSEETIFGHE